MKFEQSGWQTQRKNTWESGSLKSCSLAGVDAGAAGRCGRARTGPKEAEAHRVLSRSASEAEGLQADKAGCMRRTHFKVQAYEERGLFKRQEAFGRSLLIAGNEDGLQR